MMRSAKTANSLHCCLDIHKCLSLQVRMLCKPGQQWICNMLHSGKLIRHGTDHNLAQYPPSGHRIKSVGRARFSTDF